MPASDQYEQLENTDDDPKNCRYTSKKPHLWDRLTFGNLSGVIFRGSWGTLAAKDLQPLHTSFTARDAGGKILRLWAKRHVKHPRGIESSGVGNADGGDVDDVALIQPERPKRSVSLMSIIVRAFWSDFLWGVLCALASVVVSLAPPYLIGRLETFLGDTNQADYVGYCIAAAMMIAQQLYSLLQANVYGIMYNTGIKCKSGLASAVYEKSLRLSPSASKEFPTGDIVNMISVDLQTVMRWTSCSCILITSPISVIATFVMLYQYLGIYCLIGAVVAMAVSPLTVGMTVLEAKLQGKHMKKKDQRVEMVTEVINNIKILKLYAWEKSFMKRVQKLRAQESRLMYIYLVALNAFGFVWNCCPFLVSTSAIASFMFLNKNSFLNPQIVLVSIAYFNTLRFHLINFPYVISLTARMLVSLQRVKKFLQADEIDPAVIKDELSPTEEISLQNVTAGWSKEGDPVLRDIDLSIKKGALIAVVGPVAAGKSSLIHAVIGEINPTNGSIHRRRTSRVAYVPQQAWVLNTTIKRNVLFGARFKQKFYQEIVKKCCLVPDLKSLAAGDATEIGEKGINLSGGQKQRISLARAVYQDADIYLLDDPLSAVDAHVAQSLFKDIIGPEGLLKNKTRILVTHSVAVLPYVDRIVVLENGHVTHQGTYDEVIKENASLKTLIETHSNAPDQDVGEDARPSPLQGDLTATFRQRTASGISIGSNDSNKLDRQVPNADGNLGRLIEEEEMEVGKVRWKVYLEFLWRFGVVGVLLTLSGYTIFRLADVGSLYYITEYSHELEEKNGTTTEDMWTHMKIYLSFGGVQAIATLYSLTALSLGCVWTSTSLHNKMLDAIMKAPMSFFDSTPTGRILNRFSRDIDELDLSLYSVTDAYLETLMALIVCLVLVCIQLPSFLAILLPLLVLFLSIQQFYMATSRQIKRLNAITKSPVLNSFHETLAGTASIRAYKVQNEFTDRNMRLLDNNQNCVYHELNGYRWLAIRLDLIGNIICFAVCCVITYLRAQLPAWMGTLLFSFALQACDALTWVVRMGAQVENSLVSAERVLEYSKTKPEAPWYIDNDVPANWPSRGELEFDRYSTRYRQHLDLVLRNINLHIDAGEKVGIVGRTGAGKSSMTLALLRIIEAAEGRILIDGVDISRVGLQNLRSKIAMIPQDPVLFVGTLRENVDPEDKCSDEQVWAALEKANLKDEKKPITFKITEGGSNLSVGERQLVCLARALLRKSKLLILDEATAAVDLETDALIQKTIREDFKNSTVITVAHRLHTIIDYDRIVVLDRGEIKEFGSPKDLLSREGGIFSTMAKEANIRVETSESLPQD